MSKDELAVISPRTLAEAIDLAKTLAPSVAVPAELRGKPADVMAIIMRGSELGLPPMTALAAMHCIKGRVTLSADGMAALVRRNRDVCQYLRLVESTGDVATYETQRQGDPAPTRMSFTRAQARSAGLGGDNWNKYPDAMLRARCLSAICRAVYSDLVLGLYDPEELGAEASTPPPSTVAPPAQPTGPVVDAEVKPAARATPPAPRPKVEIPHGSTLKPDPLAHFVQGELTPAKGEHDDIIDAIHRATTTKALADLRIKRGGSSWPEAVLAEWGIRNKELHAQERGGGK